jgi:hypothetical protein
MFFMLLVVSVVGCASPGELKSLPKAGSRVGTELVQDAIANGATSCRYNLEDLLVHAMGDRRSEGVVNYPAEDIQRRPFSGSYVTTYQNGDRSNLQFVVGKDASGFCFLYWSETRFWNKSCEAMGAMYRDDRRTLSTSRIGSSLVLSGDKTVMVLLNPLSSSSCLVTESDTAWRIDTDEAARQWIKEDHGYDPAEPK